MKRTLNYYELLEVDPDSTVNQILAAYKAKAKLYHPDANGGGEAAKKLFQYLVDAKETLSDPKLRSQYDEIIGINHSPNGNSNHSGNKFPIETIIGAGLVGLIVGVALGGTKV